MENTAIDRREPRPDQIWVDYKGDHYLITGIAKYAEDKREIVLYRNLFAPKETYAHFLADFLDTGKQYGPHEKRFRHVTLPD